MLPKLYHLGSALPRQLYLPMAMPHPNRYPTKVVASNTMLLEMRRQSRGRRHQQDGKTRVTGDDPRPLPSFIEAGEKPESGRVHRDHRALSQPRLQVATKYPNPSGAPRHWRWRTRVNRSEALGQARAEELTLVPCVANFTPLQNESLPPCRRSWHTGVTKVSITEMYRGRNGNIPGIFGRRWREPH